MLRVRASLLAFIAGGILIAPLRADLRITVKETYSGMPTRTTVEYYKGNRSRIDLEPGAAYWISDFANKKSISVDPAKREYSVHRRTEHISDPSRTIAIDIENRDTGEERQIFGHPVRHIITTERRRTEYTDKPSAETQVLVTDGWYMEVPGLPISHSRIGAVAVLTLTSANWYGRQTPPKFPAISKTGDAPRGLAIWEKSENRLLEVTEFSEAPLDDTLFEAPQRFRRVVRPIPGEELSWSDQLLFGWQELLDWFDSWL